MHHEFNRVYKKIKESVFFNKDEYWLCVLSKFQKMLLAKDDTVLKSFYISTSEKGLGCLKNSFQTPVGLHQVIDKIGEQSEKNQIFKARKGIGKFAKIESRKKSTKLDLITSRILRLSGLEIAKNYGDDVDSYERCVYIHGTNEEGLIGQAVSHGCIRMKNVDIISLFNKIPERTLVIIE